jgi:hypothetical protein
MKTAEDREFCTGVEKKMFLYHSYTVKNVNGTSSNASLPKGYSSWIDFWEKKIGRRANLCQKVSCYSSATDGAHVQVEGYGNYF